MDKLKTYIKDYREVFDNETPRPGHFERFEAKLGRKERSKVYYWQWAAAAVVVLSLSAGLWLWQQPAVPPGGGQVTVVCENAADLKACYLGQMYETAGIIEELSEKLDPYTRGDVQTEVAGIIGANQFFEQELPEELPEKETREILIENTESRSQLGNRENAMRLLRSMLYDMELQRRMAEQQKVEAGKKKIEWGSQIRSYVFDDRRVKDHRTNFQTSDVNGVMDGKLDGFIKAYLMEFAGTETTEK